MAKSGLANNKYVWIGLLVAGVLFYITLNYFMEVFAPINGLLCMAIWYFAVNFIDDKAFSAVNTYEEIVKNKNMAYAIYFLGISLGSAIAFALGIFVLFASGGSSKG